MKISLIIPVYNTSKFLPDCINSCINQKRMTLGKDYEIIIVNDGSTDDSEAVCHKLAPQIREGYLIINQANSGVSKARNTGLEYAKGEYVWFIDSDDYIAHDSLLLINQKIADSQCEIVSVKRNNIPESMAYSLENTIQLQKLNKPQVGANIAFNYVVKRSYLIEHEISFNGKMSYGEDTLWCFWINFWATIDIRSINTPVYFYRQRAGSAMHNKSIEKHLDGMLTMQKEYLQAMSKYGDSINQNQLDNLKHRIRWSTDNILLDAVKLPRPLSVNIWNQLKSDGLIPHKINFTRLTFKYGIRNFLSTLIGLPLQFKFYYLFLNLLLKK